MNKHSIITMALGALVLMACQREEVDPGMTGREITFTTTLEYETRATATAFEDGDRIGITIGTPVSVNNLLLTPDGANLIPETPVYWPIDMAQDDEAEFIAFYPYSFTTTAQGGFNAADTYIGGISGDQYASGIYQAQDFMAAVTSASPADGTVELRFKHLMSRLDLTIVDQLHTSSFSDVQEYNFRSVEVNQLNPWYRVNFAQKTAAAQSGGGDSFTLAPAKIGTKAYSLILPPQTASPEIVIKLASGKTVTYVANAPISFVSGKRVSATLTLTEEKINFSYQIDDWVDDPAEVTFVQLSDAQPNNEIWYTSTNGQIVEPAVTTGFGANIVSNTYENGKGVIKFDGAVTAIGGSAFGNYMCKTLATIEIPRSVTTIGGSAFTACERLAWPVIPASVTKIGDCAFFGCYGLVDVVIPDTVAEFGESIFQACINLKSITSSHSSADNRCLIVDGVLNSFAYAGLGDTYVFPDSVTSIGNSALRNSGYNGNLVIGDKVTRIEGEAFAYMGNIQSIQIGNSVTYIGSSAFRCFGTDSRPELELPASLTSVGVDVFTCSLTKLTIHAVVPPTSWGTILCVEDVVDDENPIEPYPIYVPAQSVEAYKTDQYWGAYAERIQAIPEDQPNNEIWYTSTYDEIVEFFVNESSPSNVNVVSNTYQDGKGVIVFDGPLTTLGQQAFHGKANLSSIQLPSSLKTISVLALAETGITEIVVPEGVTLIDNGAFSYCENLQLVTLPSTLDNLGDNPFSACPSLWQFKGKYATENGRSIIKGTTLVSIAPAGQQYFTVPEGITDIGNEVFYDYPNLLQINLPSSLKTIRNQAFRNCQFETISLPDGLEEIQGMSFWNCNKLKSLILPPSVQKIYGNAFLYCTSLEYVMSLSMLPPTLSGGIFDNSNNCPIYVPADAAVSYKTTLYWSDYVNRIRPLDANLVDLGLPSGVKWASFNLGASSSEEAGLFFAWGEIHPKNEGTRDNYKYIESGTVLSKYNEDDGLTELLLEDDAAHHLLGEGWRMPTKTELDELINYCTRILTSRNGVDGYEFVSQINQNVIFIPFYTENEGGCWSSSLNTIHEDNEWAWLLSLEKDGPSYTHANYSTRRFSLKPIRPVYIAQ